MTGALPKEWPFRKVFCSQIVFHYEFEPQGDQVYYHQWWDDVVHDYPFLYTHRIDQSELDVCHGPIEARIKYVPIKLSSNDKYP